jgi:hypothetical protein
MNQPQEAIPQYEAAQETLEVVIIELREQVKRLEEENERLKWELVRPILAPPRDTRRPELMAPPVMFGFQMESADID